MKSNRIRRRGGWAVLAVVALSVPAVAQVGGILSETELSGDTEALLATQGAQDLGSDVALLGDLDGNGYDDLLVGSTYPGGPGMEDGKASILFFGPDLVLQSIVELSPGGEGITFGASVDAIGDLDGDGVVDVIVGEAESSTAASNAGAVWILRLNSNGTIKGQTEIPLPGTPYTNAYFGRSVAGIGDLNGDGVPDVVVGAPSANTKGGAWILFLKSDGTVKSTVELTEGTGLSSVSLNNISEIGRSVEGLGDLDGAGPAKLTIALGAPSSMVQGPGPDQGGVLILFLDGSGSVTSSSFYDGDGGGFVQAGYRFGTALAFLGDLDDSHATQELAIGSPGQDGGAVWIVSLDGSGSVAEHLEHVKPGPGGMAGYDNYAGGLGPIGDFDGDGRPDLGVGEPRRDTTASGSGALWLVSLDDGTGIVGGVKTWLGLTTDWFTATNWDPNGVPSAGGPGFMQTAVIPPTANDPILVGTTTIDTLFIREGASLDIAGGTSVLELDEGGTFLGPVTGDGTLRFVPTSTEGTIALSGRASISPQVESTAMTTVEFQGGPLTVSTSLTIAGDLTLESGSHLVVEGMATLDATTKTLSGSGATLELNGTSTVAMVSTAAPDLLVGADLSLDSSVYTPTEGLTTFTASVNLTQLSMGTPTVLHEVAIPASVTVTPDGELTCGGDLMLDGDLVVPAELTVGGRMVGGGGVMGTCGGGPDPDASVLTVIGGTEFTGQILNVCMIQFENAAVLPLVAILPPQVPGPVTVDVGGELTFQGSGLTVNGDLTLLNGLTVLEEDLEVTGALTLSGGELKPSGHVQIQTGTIGVTSASRLSVATGDKLTLAGDPTVTVSGTFTLEEGAELELSEATVSFESTAELEFLGTFDDPVWVHGVTSPTSGYSWTMKSGSMTSARNFLFEGMGMDGVQVEDGADFDDAPRDFRDGTFDNSAVSGATMLEITRSAPSELRYFCFENSNGNASVNVENPGGQPIAMVNADGDFAGSAPMGGGGSVGMVSWGEMRTQLSKDLSAYANRIRIRLAWTTLMEVDVEAFLLQRSGQMGGPFATVLEVPGDPDGLGRLYREIDPASLPGQPYYYRLKERLSHGEERLVTPTIAFTSGTTGPVAGTGGITIGGAVPVSFTATGARQIQSAVASASGPSAAVRVAPGVVESFTIEPTGDAAHLTIEPELLGTVEVDASHEPLRIAAVPAGTLLTLRDLSVDVGTRRGPALVLENVEGTVLLDGVTLGGALVAEGEGFLLLSGVTSPAVALRTLDARSLGGAPGDVRLLEGATLERSQARPLEVLRSSTDELVVRLDAAPTVSALLLAAPRLLSGDGGLVLDRGTWQSVTVLRGGEPTRLELPAELTGDVFLQALVFERAGALPSTLATLRR